MTDDRVFSYLREMNPVADPDSLDSPAALASSEFDTALTVGQPRMRERPGPQRRRGWLMAAAAAVVTLILGFAGWSVVNSAEDVAEPTWPMVTFDGQSCAYEGPSEFELGAERLFLVTNASDVRMEVQTWRTTDGTTIDDVDPNAIGLSPKLGPVIRSEVQPGEQKLVRALPSPPVPDEAGPWLIACFSPWGVEPAFEHPAAVVNITDD